MTPALEALRWKLVSLADWCQDRAFWRTANVLDRLSLTVYRIERTLRP